MYPHQVLNSIYIHAYMYTHKHMPTALEPCNKCMYVCMRVYMNVYMYTHPTTIVSKIKSFDVKVIYISINIHTYIHAYIHTLICYMDILCMYDHKMYLLDRLESKCVCA
jgi:hypothetical protein